MATVEETLLIKLIIDVEQTTAAVAKLEKQFKGLSEGIRSAFSTASNETLNNFSNAQKETAKSTEQLTEALKKQQRQSDSTKFAEGSYRQLNAQLKDLNNRFKELSATERQGAIGQALAKDINRIKGQLKGIDADLGDFQRNVGNYRGSLKGLFGELNNNLKSIGLRGAIRSLPALFGAISGAIDFVIQGLGKLGDIFSSTARSSRLVSEAQAEFVNELVKENIQIESNFAAATKDNATKSEKTAAINNLNSLYGEYLPNLLTEKSTNEELAVAQEIVTSKLIDNLVQKQKAIILEKAFNDVINLGLENNKKQALANATTTGTIFDFLDATTAATRISAGLADQEFKTAKAVAANGKGIEEQLKSIVKQAKDAGLDFSQAVNPDAGGQNSSAFDTLSAKKAQLEAQIKDLIVTGGDYSAQQAQLRIVTKQLTDAEEEFAKITEKSGTQLERLSKRKGELETTIKNLALADKDYTLQSKELIKVNEQLQKAEKALAEVNKTAETRLESLTNKQKALSEEIQNSIADGQPYEAQLNELIEVTKQLTGINDEYAAVQAKIDSEIKNLTQGSLAAYDAQLSALQEQQKNLNISSQEYADVTEQITQLETERSTILDALSLDIEAVNKEQQALSDQLTDQEAKNAALERAKQRLSEVTDATEGGAEKIRQINEDLQKDLQAIDDNSLQKRLNSINEEIAALQTAKEEELAIVGDNATAKAAIEAKYEKEVTDLKLQQAVINGEILQKEVDDNAVAQESITEKTSEEAEKRKAIQQQVFDAIGQASQQIFAAIEQAQQKLTEKELEQLEADKEAALKRAEFFGASEEAKERIAREFDKKRAEIEKKAAERQKTIALSQAAIDISLSILKASASAPPPANIPAIVIASALGAIQLAIIAAQKFAMGALFDIDTQKGLGYFKKGAYLKNGAYHSEGGMPIINPFTGAKVAEIERGEAIINRKNTARFYDELSFINSYKGNGVGFPQAKRMDFSQFQRSLRMKAGEYGHGGTFANINSGYLKLQQGAIVAADIARESQLATQTIFPTALLKSTNDKLDNISRILAKGFIDTDKNISEFNRNAKLKNDGKAAR